MFIIRKLTCRSFQIISRAYIWRKSTGGQYIVRIMAGCLEEYWLISESKLSITLFLRRCAVLLSVLKSKKTPPSHTHTMLAWICVIHLLWRMMGLITGWKYFLLRIKKGKFLFLHSIEHGCTSIWLVFFTIPKKEWSHVSRKGHP